MISERVLYRYHLFKLAFQERERAEGIQGCFYGEIFKSATEPLYELHLAGDW